ncbi:MAG TPA: hypothetical protein VH561_11155 [Micromonosporaceae bacterium]|jgi:predicted lipoprotein with Yx(FWY)xxD motif
MRRYTTVLGGVAVLTGLVLAGCASTSATPGSGTGPTGGTSGTTVSTMTLPGIGASLVDASGHALYFADAEVGGQIKCVDPCSSFWIPLTVADGSTPTKDATLTGTLTLVTRPDGGHQVMYDNKPLYTFVQDNAPGQATGDGFTDNFNGTAFVWHAATVSGAVASPASSASTGDGYGY